ncbi:MAG: D-alanyl-D-alanine carboxypeptidase family protein [Syntrophobacteraceae bacterium]
MGNKSLSFLFVSLFLVLSLVAAGRGMAVSTSSSKKPALKSATTNKAPKPAAEKGEGVQPGRVGAESRGSGAGKSASNELSPGQVDSRSAVLVEVSTGAVLFEQNADEPIEPASFTKILSLYLVFDALQQGRIHLNDDVWIGESAWRTGGSKMFVGLGSKVPLEELIKGIAVVSGNDACVAAAEHLYGSVDTFVEAMNRKAEELGMSKSRFLNPHGLPADGQITTARDMAALDTAYLKHFPESLRFHSMHDYSYNNIVQFNRNRLLLKDPTIDGLKTGYIEASGYHLSATAQKDGMRLIAVVMGAASPAVREREAMKLLNYGFRYYTMVRPFAAGQPAATVKVWKGVKDVVDLYPAEAASFLIAQAQQKSLRWEMHPPEEITAPVSANQSCGEMVFYVSDQPKRTIALVTHEDVARAGWFKRVWQTILRVNMINWKWVSGISGGLILCGVLFFFVYTRLSRRRQSF